MKGTSVAQLLRQFIATSIRQLVRTTNFYRLKELASYDVCKKAKAATRCVGPAPATLYNAKEQECW